MSFPENELKLLDDYVTLALRRQLPSIATRLVSAHVPDMPESVEGDGPDPHQQRAREVSNARGQLRTLLARTGADASETDGSDLDRIREIVRLLRVHEPQQALTLIEQLAPSPDVPIVENLGDAFEERAIPFIGIRIFHRPGHHRPDEPGDDIETGIPTRMQLPGFAAPGPSSDELAALARACRFLAPTPERAFRIGVLRCHALRALGGESTRAALAGYTALLSTLQGVERKFVALQLAATQLELADRLYRRLGPEPSPQARESVADLYTEAASLVQRPDIGIAVDNPLRQIVEALTELQRGKLAAGVNYLGFHPSHVPSVLPDWLKVAAAERIDEALQTITQYESFKEKATNLAEVVLNDELTRELDVINQKIDAIKIKNTGLQKTAAGDHVADLQNQITAHDWSFGLNLGMQIIQGIAGLFAAGASPAAGAPAGSGGTFTTDEIIGQGVPVLGAISTTVNYLHHRDSLKLQLAIAKNEEKVAANNERIAILQKFASDKQVAFLRDKIEREQSRELDSDRYYAAAETLRQLAVTHVECATALAYAYERAVAFLRLDPSLSIIQLDYVDRDLLTGARQLKSDLQNVATRNIPDTRFEHLVEHYSLRQLFPLEFAHFQGTGEMRFNISLPWLDKRRPGSHRMRIKYVGIQVLPTMATGTSFVGKLVHNGTFLVRDPATTPEPGMGRLVPTDEQLEVAMQQLAVGQRVDPIAGVLPYCLPPQPFDLSPDMPLPSDQRTDPLPPGTMFPIEGYGPAGSWLLEIKDANSEPLRNVTDVLFHVSYIFPPRDLDLERKVKALVRAYEQEQLDGRNRDEVVAFGLREKFPAALTQLATGRAEITLRPEDIRSSALLKTIVAKVLDRDGRGIPGVELGIARSGTALARRRTTGSDGFTDEERSLEELPIDQRFPVAGTFEITAPHPDQLAGLGNVMLYFVYELRTAP